MSHIDPPAAPKPMTVADLRASLDQLGAGHDSRAVYAWVPGSHIALTPTMVLRGTDRLLIEGNYEAGSADEPERHPDSELAANHARLANLERAISNLHAVAMHSTVPHTRRAAGEQLAQVSANLTAMIQWLEFANHTLRGLPPPSRRPTSR